MIGEVNLKYSNRDIINLVKKDLFDKFGQRELAAFDLAVPGVFETKAKVLNYPNPKVTVTSVEEQIKSYNLPVKPDVPRSANSITIDVDNTGGDSLIFTFDRTVNSLVIAGGPVVWQNPGKTGASTAAHWVGVQIGFPLGFATDVGTIIPYSHNGVPKFIPVDETVIEQGAITLYFDAAITTNDLVINWDQQYKPEKLEVLITATLEDSAVKKIPAFPKEPKFDFEFPIEDAYTEAEVVVDVDLSMGK